MGHEVARPAMPVFDDALVDHVLKAAFEYRRDPFGLLELRSMADPRTRKDTLQLVLTAIALRQAVIKGSGLRLHSAGG